MTLSLGFVRQALRRENENESRRSTTIGSHHPQQ
jgi:hypothetical protein